MSALVVANTLSADQLRQGLIRSRKEMWKRGIQALTRHIKLSSYSITCLLVKSRRERNGSGSWLERGPGRVDSFGSWSNGSRNNPREEEGSRS